jgi:UMF1 family MFS transporter
VTAQKNDRRTIFGWAMYDWANSAYSTVVAGAILPAYFAGEVVGDNGWNGRSGQVLWALGIGLSTLVLFMAMPVFGAIADFSAAKRQFMQVFAYGGALFTTLFFFAETGNVVFTLAIFFLAQLGFVGANVFYDGFLKDITTEDTIDRVSSKGFALGYLGGGLWLAIVFGAILATDGNLMVVRGGIAATGIWWAAFAWFAFTRLEDSGASETLPATVEVPTSMIRGVKLLVSLLVVGFGVLGWALVAGLSETLFNLLLGAIMIGLVVSVIRVVTSTDNAATTTVTGRFARVAAVGFTRTFTTAARLRQFPQLLLFVLAFMLYNDGVQTTINISAVFGTDTLGLSSTDIALTFLIVQFVAFGGAYLFGWIASRVDIRRAIMVNLAIWILVAVGAFLLPEGNALAFQGLGVVIGVILGGIQALSRSLYGSMIPEEASAEFYGFYSVFSKFSAIWGPIIFAMVAGLTGSGRAAILSIILFFGLGLFLFSRVDIEEARASKDRWDISGIEIATDGPVH